MSAAVAARVGAAPVVARVLGVHRGAVHVDLGDGFVATLLTPGAPMLANGVSAARVEPPVAVGWDPAAPHHWEPVPVPFAGAPGDVANLGDWLRARVPVPRVAAADAAERLVGRGPGLTPEGDDVLAGAMIAARALGPAVGAGRAEVAALVRLLSPADLRRRTGALSATLVELAADGAAPEAVHRLLSPVPSQREAGFAELGRLGASTGRALAAGIALCAGYLVGDTTVR
ncbi:MAG: DUF2877 domain-containing protein [Thermoleophilia bacterium]